MRKIYKKYKFKKPKLEIEEKDKERKKYINDIKRINTYSKL